MTTLSSVAVTVSLLLSVDGALDEQASTEAFLKAARARFETEMKTQKEILAICQKTPGTRVTTAFIVGRVVGNRERDINTKLLREAPEGEEPETFEFSPEARGKVQEAIESTLKDMIDSNVLVAQAGRGGGLQTYANNEAIKEATKKKDKLVT